MQISKHSPIINISKYVGMHFNKNITLLKSNNTKHKDNLTTIQKLPIHHYKIW
jgi:hypothetical protein